MTQAMTMTRPMTAAATSPTARHEITASPAIFGAELLARFLSFVDASPATNKTYSKCLRQFFAFIEGCGVANPTRETLIAFREYLKDNGRKPNTISLYVTSARLFFRWTSQEGIYPNIADHVKGAKVDRTHKKDYLTSEQVKGVLNGIDRATPMGKRDYAIIALMVTGGLRTIEAERANIGDLRPFADGIALYVQGKGHEEKSAPVKLHPMTERAIREYLATRADGANPSAPLFAGFKGGERISTRTLSRIAKEGMRAAGLDSERLTAHSLRHTAVTLALLGGESLERASQFARHANLSTTMIYNHALREAENTCASTVGKSIFG